MPNLVPPLDWDDRTEDKLWAHGLTIDDALAVARGSPVIMRQVASPEVTSEGSIRIRPARLLLIGPGRSNRLLTFVLEYPQRGGYSRIVTGWPAANKERGWYRQRETRQR